MIQYPSYKVAAAHVAPVFMDVEATVDKACSLIREAAGNGAQLVVFPEVYVPAFPLWCSLQAPIHNHDLFRALAASSIRVPGPELEMVADTARDAGVFVSLGFNEGTEASVGCIWNSNVLIGDDGSILCHHRKIVPTFYEKLVWAPGDGAGLQVSDTRIGRLGMLICGENTNPLARYTLMAQGEQVHMSTYPSMWPTHDPATGDNYDLEHAIKIRAGAHSFEGKAFNIVASGFLDKKTRDLLAGPRPRRRQNPGREPAWRLGRHRTQRNAGKRNAPGFGGPAIRRHRPLGLRRAEAVPRRCGRIQPLRYLQADRRPHGPKAGSFRSGW